MQQIPFQKETNDIYKIVDMIYDDNWVTEDTIFVNCNPMYSSFITQILDNQIGTHQVLNLEVPNKIRNAVWNAEQLDYQDFTKYLYEWKIKYLNKKDTYLFIDSGLTSDVNMAKIKNMVKDRATFKFCSLYYKQNKNFKPDYFLEIENEFSFEWQNKNPKYGKETK